MYITIDPNLQQPLPGVQPDLSTLNDELNGVAEAMWKDRDSSCSCRQEMEGFPSFRV